MAVLFKSVLSEYNRTYGARLRLRIPKSDDLEPRLPIEACVYFDWFTAEAIEHPYNDSSWRRLYVFIAHVDSRRVVLDVIDFARLLELNGVPPGPIEMYATFYHRARAMHDFASRNPWDNQPSADGWKKWCDIANGSTRRSYNVIGKADG
jgi:hypothetical protein